MLAVITGVMVAGVGSYHVGNKVELPVRYLVVVVVHTAAGVSCGVVHLVEQIAYLLLCSCKRSVGVLHHYHKYAHCSGGVALFQWIATSNQDMIEEMKMLLDKAGIRQGNALEEFMKSKAIAAIALFMIVFVILSTNDFGIPILACIPLSLIIGVVGGHKLTNMNMEMLANKRKDAIENGIPDLVDLLVICAESGLDLNTVPSNTYNSPL